MEYGNTTNYLKEFNDRLYNNILSNSIKTLIVHNIIDFKIYYII